MTGQNDISEIPRPRASSKSGMGTIILAALALAAAGGLAYWLTSDAPTRERLKNRIMGIVEETPLGAVGKYVMPPPPPPSHAGRTPLPPIASSGPAPQGAASMPQAAEEIVGGMPAPAPETVASKVKEDSVVRLLFVEDLAQWLAARYQPGRAGDGLNWNLQSLNLRYGAQLRGFNHGGEDAVSGRAALLRYAFNSPMLTALYDLYADRFVEALAHAASEPRQGKPPLTPEQTDDMFRAYARRFATLSGVVRGIASLKDFSARMAEAAQLSRRVGAVHGQMTEAVFALDEAREARSKNRMEAAQSRIDGFAAQYQRAVSERDAARRNFLNAVRQAAPGAREADDDGIMFAAAWMERRLSRDPQSLQTMIVAAGLLEDLSDRLRKAGSIAR